MGSEPQKDNSQKPASRSNHRYVNLGSGWRRPAEEFGYYGEAFHKAARELVRVLDENPSYDPFEACPIVFLYRHATELYLKGVLRSGESLLKLEGIQPTFDASALTAHPLRPLLTPLRELFEAMEWGKSYEEIASFVEPLDQMDPNSFCFRYPVNKKDEAALPKSFGFNVVGFAREADSCLEILYNASYSIADCAESARAARLDYAGEL